MPCQRGLRYRPPVWRLDKTSSTRLEMAANAIVWIGAESPLFQYSPTRNGPMGSSWLQGSGGTICGGPSTFAVQIDGLFCESSGPPRRVFGRDWAISRFERAGALIAVSQVVVHWSSTGSFAVRVGLDGTLQDGQSATGATLTAALGRHDLRLEVVCEACSVDAQFTLRGVEIATVL